MACIRRRRGKWIVDFRDGTGTRRWLTCDTRREAENALSEQFRLARHPARPLFDPRITLAAYAAHWLGLVRATAKPRTYETYDGVVERHVLPALGRVPVARLHRAHLKQFLAAKLARAIPGGT